MMNDAAISFLMLQTFRVNENMANMPNEIIRVFLRPMLSKSNNEIRMARIKI
jgi:hypothetical protein